jgi:DNA mismatch repair protein MutL
MSEQGLIQVLPAHVANQIAAGEVVQRPASIVKELVENAVDAGATRIDVHLTDAGRTLVHVIDTGSGMSPADAVRCFERHATSKLRNADDLFALLTKGFRGEALASIASVARVDLRTCRPGDAIGTRVQAEGGDAPRPEALPATPGTSIAVRDLFFNIPARRAFLKSDAVELRHCLDEFQRVALAHPDIAFTLTSNGQELYHLRPGSPRARILGIFGARYDERLVPIDEDTDVVRVTGFVGKPAFARKSRGEQFLFVNRRFIRHPALHRAICDGFAGLLPPDALPFYVLFLEVDPARVDINIHPTKIEVKFDEERTITALLRPAIRRGLGRFQVAPALDFDQEASLSIAPLRAGTEVREPRVKVDTTYNPFRSSGSSSSSSLSSSLSSSFSLSGGAVVLEPEIAPSPSTSRAPQPPLSSSSPSSSPSPSPSTSFSTSFSTSSSPSPSSSTSSSSSLSTSSSFSTSPSPLPRYIITPVASGIVVVDPHRAHARVLYEELLARHRDGEGAQEAGSGVVAQRLLFPEECLLPPAERAWMLAERERLMEWGLHIEGAEGGVRVLAVPAEAEASPVELVEAVVGAGDVEAGMDGEGRWERLAARLARARAVRPGTVLTAEAQADLLDRLFGCEVPGLDPFGRPAVVTFTADEIRERFT